MQTSQSPAATASQQAREPPRQGQGDRERAAANTIAATDQPGRKLAHLRPFDGTFGIPGAAPPEHAPRRGRRIPTSSLSVCCHVHNLVTIPIPLNFDTGCFVHFVIYVVAICFLGIHRLSPKPHLETDTFEGSKKENGSETLSSIQDSTCEAFLCNLLVS